MAPREKMSVVWSMSSMAPWACSGLMKWGVPSTVFIWVSCIWLALILEMPKSSSLTWIALAEVSTRKIFPGFRSRCTMPCSCTLDRALAVCSSSCATASTGSGPSRLSRTDSSSPSRYSITMYGWPLSSSLKSVMKTMWGCPRPETISASIIKRVHEVGSSTTASCRTLMANRF